jgi:hypothetical protein
MMMALVQDSRVVVLIPPMILVELSATIVAIVAKAVELQYD